MKHRIPQYVGHCSVCQQAKSERVSYPSLLQPLQVPQQAWQIVSVDFIEGLPKSSSYDCILVVVDKFSIKLAHLFSARKVLSYIWIVCTSYKLVLAGIVQAIWN